MAPKTAQRWFEVSRPGDGLTRIVEPYADPLIRCNIWHVRGRDRDLLIDTGLGLAPLAPLLSALAERQPWAVVTHTHFDHAGGMHEFETRLVHRAEARALAEPGYASIRVDDFPAGYQALFPDPRPGGELVTAYPFASFDSSSFCVLPAAATRIVEEGDVIDLGDRVISVLHLPGHSPGSIGLWDAESGTLFSGDAMYDGELLEQLPGSDPQAYTATMERLRSLPVTVVHGGHCESFGRSRMIEIIESFLAARGA
jgi:glyoxylase-like metal-dependent hydrolase (beta-lactamase superfamily II)